MGKLICTNIKVHTGYPRIEYTTHAFISPLKMYPAQQQGNFPMQNYPSQQPQVLSAPGHVRSSWLIGFGITEIIFSKMLFGWCIWVFILDGKLVVPYIALTCALFHIIVGILAVFGGRDSLRYRRCVIALLVLSIIGSCLFVTSTLSADLIEWSSTGWDCFNCIQNEEINLGSYVKIQTRNSCRNMCVISNRSIIFGPIIFFLFVECVVGIILSGISCCRLCRCCGCCYAGENANTVSYQAFPPPNTSYYNLREDNIQHSIPEHHPYYEQQTQNVV